MTDNKLTEYKSGLLINLKSILFKSRAKRIINGTLGPF